MGHIGFTPQFKKKFKVEGQTKREITKLLKEAKLIGISDLNKKYELNEIVSGDSIFCASGITSSDILKGISIDSDKFISETLVSHKSSNFKKIITSVNSINE